MLTVKGFLKDGYLNCNLGKLRISNAKRWEECGERYYEIEENGSSIPLPSISLPPTYYIFNTIK